MTFRGLLLHEVRPYFRWFDLWVGIYVKRPTFKRLWVADLLDDDYLMGMRQPFFVYVQILPMFGLRLELTSPAIRVKRTEVDELMLRGP